MGLGLESLVIAGIGGAGESKRMIGILGCSSGNQRGRKAIPLYASQATYVDEFRIQVAMKAHVF
jgi:hypothetical protein